MLFVFQERPSDSSYVEKIWRTQSERADSFVSLAVSHWEIVVWKHQGKPSLTVRGPETKATVAHCPEDAEFFGIQFKLGTFMPHLPAKHLVDGAVTVPAMSRTTFWLHGSAWEFPDYDTADTFVDHLVRTGLLVRDPVVDSAVQGRMHDRSLRSVQYHFVRATGLTQPELVLPLPYVSCRTDVRSSRRRIAACTPHIPLPAAHREQMSTPCARHHHTHDSRLRMSSRRSRMIERDVFFVQLVARRRKAHHA